jgi:hypothetical protein
MRTPDKRLFARMLVFFSLPDECCMSYACIRGPTNRIADEILSHFILRPQGAAMGNACRNSVARLQARIVGSRSPGDWKCAA